MTDTQQIIELLREIKELLIKQKEPLCTSSGCMPDVTGHCIDCGEKCNDS